MARARRMAARSGTARSPSSVRARLEEAARIERALRGESGPRARARAEAMRASLLDHAFRARDPERAIELALAVLRLEPTEPERARAYQCIEAAGERLGASDAAAEAWLALAVDAWASGRRPLAEQAAARAHTVASALDRPRLTARAHIELARIAFGSSDMQSAREHTEAARALVAGRELDLEVAAHIGLAAIGSHELSAGAARHARRAILLAEELGDRALLARAQAQLGIVLVERGIHDEGRTVLEDAIAIERERGEGENECRALLYLAMLELDAGRPLQSLQCLARAKEIAEQRGSRVARGMVHGSIGVVHLVRGHPGAAARELSRADLLLEDLGNRHARITFSAFLGAAEALARRPGESRAAFEQAHALMREGGGPRYGAELVRVLEGVRALVEGASAGSVRATLAEVERGPIVDHWADLRVGCALVRRALHGDATAKLPHVEPTEGLVVASDARWFSLEGARPVDLETRPVLRRLLAQLADARSRAPGVTIPREELARALWPEDSRLSPRLLANRVNVAIATLRRLGLRDALRTGDRGYRLREDVQLTFDPGPSARVPPT